MDTAKVNVILSPPVEIVKKQQTPFRYSYSLIRYSLRTRSRLPLLLHLVLSIDIVSIFHSNALNHSYDYFAYVSLARLYISLKISSNFHLNAVTKSHHGNCR